MHAFPCLGICELGGFHSWRLLWNSILPQVEFEKMAFQGISWGEPTIAVWGSFKLTRYLYADLQINTAIASQRCVHIATGSRRRALRFYDAIHAHLQLDSIILSSFLVKLTRISSIRVGGLYNRLQAIFIHCFLIF